MPVPADPGWTLATDDHGCQVWRNPNDHHRGGTDNPDTKYCGRRVAKEDPEAPNDDGCPLTSAIAVKNGPYARPLSSAGACTEMEAKALADNAGAVSISEWQNLVSAQCSACAFSGDGDHWAPIVVGNDRILHINRGGCIELKTGNEACGRAYQQFAACGVSACTGCSTRSDLLACINDMATLSAGPCKAAFDAATVACGDDLTAAETACAGTSPFEGPIMVQCVTGAGVDGGGG